VQEFNSQGTTGMNTLRALYQAKKHNAGRIPDTGIIFLPISPRTHHRQVRISPMLYNFDESAFFVCITTLALLLIILRFQKRSFSYLLFFLIFGIYMIGVVSVVIFPIYYGPDAVIMTGREFWSNINLIPFNFGDCQIERICREQIIQNIILTMPFGFGVSFIARLRARDFVWLPFAVGLGFEITQFMISKGGFHALDINDALLNAAGVWLGYACFRVFAWLYAAIMQRFGGKPWGVFAFIQDVVSRA
jgi:glycopeptide antibiotics resistance protein